MSCQMALIACLDTISEEAMKTEGPYLAVKDESATFVLYMARVRRCTSAFCE